jgi:hypothetical protein
LGGIAGLRDSGLNYCGIFGVNYSGSQHYALETWKKFSILKKGCLLGLRKFSNQDESDQDEKSLSAIILGVSKQYHPANPPCGNMSSKLTLII